MFLGEQPPSSMSPIVLKSPLRTLVIGSTGATMITTGIASVGIHDNHTRGRQQTDPPPPLLFFFQALMNHLWFQKSLKESIGAPVMFVDSRAELTFEPTFDKVLRPTRFYEPQRRSVCD